MIHIVQCLCPQRHCMMAALYDPEKPGASPPVEVMRDVVGSLIAGGVMDPWCGICGSREFTYEDKETGWRTMDEATPAARAIEAAQLATREIIQGLRRAQRN